MSKPACESNEICPLMHKKRSLVCHKCAWFVHVQGTHPQTGDRIDHWDCSIAMLPMIMIETGRETHVTNDAIVSLRNEIVDGNNKKIASDVIRTQVLLKAASQR